jgi:outer membrane protein OmpA-like peptidoglycan-associated protein
MRKQLLFLPLVFSVAIVAAQSRVAVVGGLHSTSVSPFLNKQASAISTTETKRTGVHFGFLADVPIREGGKLFFQPGILYSAKGTTHQQLLDTSATSLYQFTTKQSINYIDVPLNLVLKLPLKGKTKFILGAGPQASLFYNGSSTTTTIDTLDQYEAEENKDLPVGKDDQKFRVLHFGINGLAGFEFGRVFLTANYSKSLSPFYKEGAQSFNYTSFGATLGIFLGKQPEPAKKPVDNDRDKDGVVNAEDLCPDVAGTSITNGCPDKDADGIADATDQCPELAGTAKNNGCPVLDKDSDRIKDDVDNCPDVAGTAKYNGCPVPDTDKDGINDEEDNCPQVAGVAQNKGCPEVKREVIKQEVIEKVTHAAREIRFKVGKDQLLPESFTVLDDVANLLKEDAELKITVEGHTSSDGTLQANQALSQKRADRVKEYLVSKGISAERITAIGYGPSRPLMEETSEEAKAANRRVEMKLSR